MPGPSPGRNRKPSKIRLPILIFAVVVLGIASASTVTVSKTSYADYGGFFLKPYYENANPPVTGCTSPCLTVDTQTTQPATSSSFALSSSSSMYLWSPQFAGATSISAGKWDLDFWVAAAAYTYVAITLTNSQTSATPTPYQALVQTNPSSYSTYEASDLGNVGFCTSASCATKLYSWLEGCGNSAPYGPCSTSSTVATFWVKLTSAIAANGGTLIIYMVFLPTSTEFDGVYRGEASQLSANYAQYDNGASVFDLYFNGNTATSSFNIGGNNGISQKTTANPISGGSTINVISLTGYGAANRVNMILTTPLPAGNPTYGEIAESYSEIQAGDAGNLQGLAGFCDSTTAGSGTINAESEVVGNAGTLYSYVYVAGGTATKVTGGGVDAALTWYYAALAYPGTGSTSFSGIVSTTFYSAYAASTAFHPISGSAQLYWCSVGVSVAGNPDGLYFNWGRARAYPPSGVAPSVSLGALTSNTIGVSIYTTTSSGSTYATVATNVQSPLLGVAQSEYTMTIAGAQETVPANGYISIVIVASSDSYTFYWGATQPTNFQVAFTSRS
jgi:hypothetical protein